jgi:hypothetical protein
MHQPLVRGQDQELAPREVLFGRDQIAPTVGRTRPRGLPFLPPSGAKTLSAPSHPGATRGTDPQLRPQCHSAVVITIA